MVKCKWSIVVALTVILLLPCRQSVALQLTGDPDQTFERLEAWLVAVIEHQPGMSDEPLLNVSSWSNTETRSLWLQTSVLAQLMRNFTQQTFQYPWGPNKRARIPYPEDSLTRLRLLACAAGGRVDDFPCVTWNARASLSPGLLRLNEAA